MEYIYKKLYFAAYGQFVLVTRLKRRLRNEKSRKNTFKGPNMCDTAGGFHSKTKLIYKIYILLNDFPLYLSFRFHELSWKNIKKKNCAKLFLKISQFRHDCIIFFSTYLGTCSLTVLTFIKFGYLVFMLNRSKTFLYKLNFC